MMVVLFSSLEVHSTLQTVSLVPIQLKTIDLAASLYLKEAFFISQTAHLVIIIAPFGGVINFYIYMECIFPATSLITMLRCGVGESMGLLQPSLSISQVLLI